MTLGDGGGSMAASGWIIGLVIMLFLIAVIIVVAAFVKKRQNKHVPNNPWVVGGDGSVRRQNIADQKRMRKFENRV